MQMLGRWEAIKRMRLKIMYTGYPFLLGIPSRQKTIQKRPDTRPQQWAVMAASSEHTAQMKGSMHQVLQLQHSHIVALQKRRRAVRTLLLHRGSLRTKTR